MISEKLRILALLLPIQIWANVLKTSGENCAANFYFNTPNFNCDQCGPEAVQNPSFPEECMCEPGHKKVYDTRFDFLFECEPCPSGQTPTRD